MYPIRTILRLLFQVASTFAVWSTIDNPPGWSGRLQCIFGTRMVRGIVGPIHVKRFVALQHNPHHWSWKWVVDVNVNSTELQHVSTLSLTVFVSLGHLSPTWTCMLDQTWIRLSCRMFQRCHGCTEDWHGICQVLQCECAVLTRLTCLRCVCVCVCVCVLFYQ